MKKRLTLKKAVSSVVAVMMCISAGSALSVSAEGVEANAEIYQSSVSFNADNNPSGQWTWQYYDPESNNLTNASSYKNLAYVKPDEALGGNVWINHPILSSDNGADEGYEWGNGSVCVGAEYMRADVSLNWGNATETENNNWWIDRDYPVKTFTAPKAGVVKIDAAKPLEATEKGTDVRIMKITSDNQVVQIWPASDWKHISGNYTFIPKIISLTAGEKLTFENCFKYNRDSTKGNQAWDTLLKWDPTVEYISPDRYVSSHYVTAQKPNAPWIWQYYDWDGTGSEASKYVNLAHTKGDNWINHPVASPGDTGYEWGNGSVAVGENYMIADTSAAVNSDESRAIKRDYPVMTFVSPKTGLVKIGANSILNATANGTNIRIMKLEKDSEKPVPVWPAGDWQKISGEYTFKDILVSLNEGDKLTFENRFIYDSYLSNAPADTALNWDPTVEFVEPSDVYKATEYFGATNPNSPWAWQFYDWNGEGSEASKYVDLAYPKNESWINHPVFGNGNGADEGYEWGNGSVMIAQDWMMADVTKLTAEEENKDTVMRDYPVRTFTAPKAGVVQISADDMIKTAQNKTNIRIMHISADGTIEKVWPSDADWYKVGTDGLNFEPINLRTAEGDKITFEDAFKHTGSDVTSPYDTKVYWEPVVSYVSYEDIYVNSVTFKTGDTEISKDFAAICGAGNISAEVNVCCNNSEATSAVVLLGIYNDSGALVSVGLSESKQLTEGKDNSFSVNVSGIPNISKGKIKLFVFDSLSTLRPLSSDGSFDFLKAE